MVREAIARRAGSGYDAPARDAPARDAARVHASHATFQFLPSGDPDGACVIEPAVRCNHCGYCLSFGH